MFTGIIQTQALVKSIQRKSEEARFTFSPRIPFNSLQIGESIAVNGVCLTVESFDTKSFSAYASAKTLELTNLGNLKTESIVNLERALALGDRLGGHIVSGHIDCTTPLLHLEEKLSSKICRFALPQEMQGLIIPQGSVCLDGISLTVTEVKNDSFCVNIIPETWKETTAALWKVGSAINLESDLIGKYVHSRSLNYTQKQESKLTVSYLKEMGF